MSEHPFPDDELLSSHLDGELTDDEHARLVERLDTDPALRDRLRVLEEAQELTHTPVSALPPVDADRLIAAALATSGTSSNVTDLSAAAARRRSWVPRVAVAAAAVVAVALTVPALRAINTDNDDMATATLDPESSVDADMRDDEAAEFSAADGAPEADVTADMGPEEGEPAGDPATERANSFLPSDDFNPLPDDLGSFDSAPELADAVGAPTFTGPEQPSTTGTSLPYGGSQGVEASRDDALVASLTARLDGLGITPCADFVTNVTAYFTDRQVIAADYAAATIDGAPATVGLFRLSDGSAELLVVDQGSCVPLGVALE